VPLRRTIGISLAFLVISASAVAKTHESGTVQRSGHSFINKHGKAASRHRRSWTASCSQAHRATHHGRRSRHWYADNSPPDSVGSGPPDVYSGPVRPIGPMQVGTAAWYNWVGSRTASGEVLDWVTPTAAHRSLPLASYAKVTNLDTGRAIVVKINDRGPYHRRFIIDLSPRAAEEIGVIDSGIAAVTVEPVAGEPETKNEAGEAVETRAASQPIPYTQPAWVDPRLGRPAPNDDEAGPAREMRVARDDSGALPFDQPAWVDPRLQQQ
jgi:rare lipoprotein A (peptidoglycan hydrolase)